MKKGFNYARFYTLLKKMPGADKETLVYCTTCGRTTSLREMTSEEYDELCASMEELTGWKVQVKKARSVCLKLMQQAGIDTTDWQRINDFCRHPKIAGKVFAQLSLADKATQHYAQGRTETTRDTGRAEQRYLVYLYPDGQYGRKLVLVIIKIVEYDNENKNKQLV